MTPTAQRHFAGARRAIKANNTEMLYAHLVAILREILTPGTETLAREEASTVRDDDVISGN